MATFDTQINSWVNAVQFHDASAAQLALYNAQLQAGTSQQTVQFNIISEGQTLAFTNPVVRMYQAAFGRIPDLGGQKGWVNQLQTGANTIPAMGNWFASAPEFANLYNGANASTPANKVLVDAFYINVLQRAPDAQGEAFWISSGLKAGQLLTAFSESAEFIGTSLPQAQGLQQLNIQGQYPSNVFVSLFNTPSYQQVISGNVGYTLTPNVDVATANQFNGNLVFVPAAGGSVQTITNGDNLTGTGTNPTLRGQLNTAATTITTTGVQTVSLQNVSGALSTLTGTLTGVNVLTNNASTNALAVTGLQSLLQTLNVTNVVGGNTTGFTVNNNAFTGTPALTVNLSGATSGAITATSTGLNNYQTITVNSTGGSLNSVAGLGVNTVNSNGVSTDTTLNITGDTALRLAAVDATLTTINAGAQTAGGAAFAQNLTLGSTTALALTGTATITGGNGQNKIYIGNFGTNYTVNGGTGTNNTLVLTGILGATGGTATNFQTVELSGPQVGGGGNNAGVGFGAAAATFTASGLTGVKTVQLDGGAGNTGLVTLISLPLTSNALTLNLVGNGANVPVGGISETFNPVSFAGLVGTTNTLTENISNQGTSVGANGITVGAQTLTGFSTVNYNVVDQAATGVTTIGTLTAPTLTTEKIVSTGAVTLTNVVGSLTTLDTSGVAGVQTIPAITPAANVTAFTLNTGAGNATVGGAGFTDHVGATPLTTLTVNAAGNLTLPIAATVALTTESFTETASGKAINVATHTEATLTNLSLTGTVNYQATAIVAATGLTVSGAAGNGNVGLTAFGGGHAVIGAADNISLGNGNNVITDNSPGPITISNGTGFSTVTLSSAQLAPQTVVFGTHTSTGATDTAIVGGVINAGNHDAVGLISNAGSLTNFATITGFGVNDAVNTVANAALVMTTVAANTDLSLAAFATSATVTAAGAGMYEETIGGTTYVISNVLGGAVGAGDTVIGITGAHTAAYAAGAVITLLS